MSSSLADENLQHPWWLAVPVTFLCDLYDISFLWAGWCSDNILDLYSGDAYVVIPTEFYFGFPELDRCCDGACFLPHPFPIHHLPQCHHRCCVGCQWLKCVNWNSFGIRTFTLTCVLLVTTTELWRYQWSEYVLLCDSSNLIPCIMCGFYDTG
jgi:hypothetical protein